MCAHLGPLGSTRAAHFFWAKTLENLMNKLDEKVVVLRARLFPQHIERMTAIGQATGLNISEIMRQLIENSEVKPAKMGTQIHSNEGKRNV
jgi:hypothetical protein